MKLPTRFLIIASLFLSSGCIPNSYFLHPLDLIGGTPRSPGIEINPISAEQLYSYQETSFGITREPAPGNVFLVITLTLTNIDNYAHYADPGDFSIADSEGFRYDPKGGFLGADTENALKITQLFPGEKAQGKILFQIPSSATGLILKYDFSSQVGKPRITTWQLKDRTNR